VIWIVLAAIGVPLWLCALGLFTLIARNRKLRSRGGDLFVRRRLHGKTRWGRGHGVWVHDVFAYRGSPAAWSESLLWVATATTRAVADASEAKKLRRLGENPVIILMTGSDGSTVEFATRLDNAVDLLGPLAVQAAIMSPGTVTKP
jgi:hypothetical protein